MLSERIAHASVPDLPSNRSFGLLFAFVFLVVGVWPYLGSLIGCAGHWRELAESCLPALQARSPNLWALVASAVFLLTALVYPKVLLPLNRLWMAFGNVLHILVSSLVLGILFVLVITPFGLVMRAARRDALGSKLDPSARSYWIHRIPPGPDPKTLSNQF